MQSPRAVVEAFFDRMADTDRRETIGELFTDDAVITVPGDRFEGAAAASAFLAYLEPRYAWAAKEYDRWITADDDVISIGRLYGVDNDGEDFADVRYVDIYHVVDGRITRLDIYNDLAAVGVV
jgi:limonene-1,2-epoxide hydrolase